MRGKAGKPVGVGRVRRDHPRMCGEKFAQRVPVLEEQRITPACAGKSIKPMVVNVNPQDHPRMCGEKQNREAILPRRRGSPPHVRGKVLFSDGAW